MKQVSKTDFSAMTSPDLLLVGECLQIISNKTVIGYFTPPDVWAQQLEATRWIKKGSLQEGVGCILTPERYAAFEIACGILGITIDQCLADAVTETIRDASLMPDNDRLPQEEDGDG